MSEQLALKRARKGAAFLDEKLGRGWRRKIKRTRLNMGNGRFVPSNPASCGCVLAQLSPRMIDDRHEESGIYVRGAEMVGLNGYSHRAMHLGFIDYGNVSHSKLTNAWRQVLREKSDA